MPKKQKSGLYRTKITIGHEPDGKPIVKYVSGATKAQLDAAKQEAVRYHIEGDTATKDQLFGAFVVEWFAIKKAPRLTEISIANYRTLINAHILPHFGDRQLRALRANDLQKWIDQFARSSESKIDKLYMLIRAIIRDAHAGGYIPRDIAAGLTKPLPAKGDVRRALTNSETVAVLKIIADHPDGDLLAAMYYLGVRRGEALGLQWADFDFDARMVHIQRDIVYARGRTTIGDLKSRVADRYVVVPVALADRLSAQMGAADAWVFPGERGGPMSQTSYKRMWIGLMEFGGLVEAKEPSEAVKRKHAARAERKSAAKIERMDLFAPTITAHYLRHNYTTKLFYAGVDAVIAMWMVGHESYETTVDVYTHLRNARFAEPPIDMEWVYEIKKEAIKIQRPDQIFAKMNSETQPEK